MRGARATSANSRLEDTGVFDEIRYFDVIAEYAKADPDDILIRITLANRGPEAATLHVLPTVWFRNTWSWGCTHEGCTLKPRISQARRASARPCSTRRCDPSASPPRPAAPWLFTENETNNERLFGSPNLSPYVKDAFHEAVVHGQQRGGESARIRHEGRAALRAVDSGRRRGGACASGWPRRTRWPAVPFARFRGRVRHAARGGRRVLRYEVLAGARPPSSATSCARPTRACCGRSSFTTTS